MTAPKLISAEYINGHRLRLSFSDGLVAQLDFSKELAGGVFEELRNPDYFASFKFNSQFGTIEWKNGADFAPEFLYESARKNSTLAA